MEHSDIEHMAQGYPPAHIAKDSEEVIVWLATQLLATQEQRDALAAENAALLVRLSSVIDIVSKADNRYCMCGESMDSHTLGGCGSPIGMLDYHFGKLTEEKTETPTTDAWLKSINEK